MSGVGQELALIPKLSLVELAVRWQVQGLGPLPRAPLRLLRRLYAQLLQDRTLGGLPPSVVRDLGKFEAGKGRSMAPTPPPPPRQVILSS